MKSALAIAIVALGLAACASGSLRPGTPGSDGGAGAGAATSTGSATAGTGPANTPGAAEGDAAPGSDSTFGGGAPADRAGRGSVGAVARGAGPVGAGANRSEPVRRFVSAAMDMLGQPYRRGGTGPGGFDCSGLVAYAGRQVGLKFPRTAREQQRGGVPVARAALEPGDLVFMRLRGRQHHVGIMIDGVHFVHAPSSGGRVRVDSLDSKPYASRILAVRRPDFPR